MKRLVIEFPSEAAREAFLKYKRFLFFCDHGPGCVTVVQTYGETATCPSCRSVYLIYRGRKAGSTKEKP